MNRSPTRGQWNEPRPAGADWVGACAKFTAAALLIQGAARCPSEAPRLQMQALILQAEAVALSVGWGRWMPDWTEADPCPEGHTLSDRLGALGAHPRQTAPAGPEYLNGRLR